MAKILVMMLILSGPPITLAGAASDFPMRKVDDELSGSAMLL